MGEFISIAFCFLSQECCRHTHNNVDAVFPRFTKVFFGYGDNPGLAEGINTMEEFDQEFQKCFKNDDIQLKRMIGCLDFKTIFEDSLGFANYAPGKKSSAAARAQGGRDKEYHSIHFFLDENGVARCKGRYDELQTHWLPLEGSGIAVFSELGQLRANALLAAGDHAAEFMPYDTLNDWDLRSAICENLTRHPRLTDVQRLSWKRWFDDLPTSVDNVRNEFKFSWSLPKLIKRVRERERACGLLVPRVELGESTDYQQDPRYMGEVFTHPGYTKSQLQADRRQRARNFTNRKTAEDRQQAALRLQNRREKRMREAQDQNYHEDQLRDRTKFANS